MLSNHLILCQLLLLLPSIYPASGSFPTSGLFTSGGHRVHSKAGTGTPQLSISSNSRYSNSSKTPLMMVILVNLFLINSFFSPPFFSLSLHPAERLTRIECLRNKEQSSACVLNHVRLFETLWAVARQASLSVGVSRQQYWNGLPFHSPGGLPNPGIKPTSPVSPALPADSLATEPSRKPMEIAKREVENKGL